MGNGDTTFCMLLCSLVGLRVSGNFLPCPLLVLASLAQARDNNKILLIN